MAEFFVRIAVPEGKLERFRTKVAPRLEGAVGVEVSREPGSVLFDVLSERAGEIMTAAKAAGFETEAHPEPDPLLEASTPDPALAKALELLTGVNAPLIGFTVVGLFVTPVPASPETLPCPSRTVFATGRAQAMSRAVFTLKEAFFPSRADELEDEAIAAARADAYDQFVKALAGQQVACEANCRLSYELLMGTPAVENVVTLEAPGLNVPLTARSIARVPWEAAFVCGEAEVVPDESAGSSERPLTCGQAYIRSGRTVIEEDHFPPTPPGTAFGNFNPFPVTDAHFQRLLKKARDDINDELGRLPRCPQVSCPNPRVTMSVGTPSSSFRKEGTKKFVTTYQVTWRVALVCQN
jgi:hypothetical protein